MPLWTWLLPVLALGSLGAAAAIAMTPWLALVCGLGLGGLLGSAARKRAGA